MKQKQIDSYWLEVKQKKSTKVPKTFLKELILPESLIQEGRVLQKQLFILLSMAVLQKEP